MLPKQPPLEKTLVTQFLTEIADINIRQKQLKESMATRLPLSSNLRVGDFNIIAGQSLILDGIGTVIQVHGYTTFWVDIVNGLTSTSFLCDGLFIAFTALDRVSIRRDQLDTRVTYICA